MACLSLLCFSLCLALSTLPNCPKACFMVPHTRHAVSTEWLYIMSPFPGGPHPSVRHMNAYWCLTLSSNKLSGSLLNTSSDLQAWLPAAPHKALISGLQLFGHLFPLPISKAQNCRAVFYSPFCPQHSSTFTGTGRMTQTECQSLPQPTGRSLARGPGDSVWGHRELDHGAKAWVQMAAPLVSRRVPLYRWVLRLLYKHGSHNPYRCHMT